jgi:hypothetical protein
MSRPTSTARRIPRPPLKISTQNVEADGRSAATVSLKAISWHTDRFFLH